jgi:hypothetical protein
VLAERVEELVVELVNRPVLHPPPDGLGPGHVQACVVLAAKTAALVLRSAAAWALSVASYLTHEVKLRPRPANWVDSPAPWPRTATSHTRGNALGH